MQPCLSPHFSVFHSRMDGAGSISVRSERQREPQPEAREADTKLFRGVIFADICTAELMQVNGPYLYTIISSLCWPLFVLSCDGLVLYTRSC